MVSKVILPLVLALLSASWSSIMWRVPTIPLPQQPAFFTTGAWNPPKSSAKVNLSYLNVFLSDIVVMGCKVPGEREPLYTVIYCWQEYSMKSVGGTLKNWKESHYVTQKPHFLSKGNEMTMWRDLLSPMLMVTLLTIVMIWNQLESLLTAEWIQECGRVDNDWWAIPEGVLCCPRVYIHMYTHAHASTYTHKYARAHIWIHTCACVCTHTHTERKMKWDICTQHNPSQPQEEILSFATKGVNLEETGPREIKPVTEG